MLLPLFFNKGEMTNQLAIIDVKKARDGSLVFTADKSLTSQEETDIRDLLKEVIPESVSIANIERDMKVTKENTGSGFLSIDRIKVVSVLIMTFSDVNDRKIAFKAIEAFSYKQQGIKVK